MFVSSKVAAKVFRSIPPVEYEVKKDKNGKITEMVVFGNEFTYTIHRGEKSFVILAQKGGEEKPLELFHGIREFTEADGKLYRESYPYFTFNTGNGAYYITVRKQVREKQKVNGEKEVWKTVHYYNFQIL